MSDIDHVFARMGGSQSASSEQHEQRRIARRSGLGTRVVEVVRLAPKGGAGTAGPRRNDPMIRAQSWEDGFPAKSQPAPSPPSRPVEAAAPKAVGHVLSRSQPAFGEVDNAAPDPVPVERQPAGGARRLRRSSVPHAATPVRRVADPFDLADDGANCLRCGYLVEPARDRRGLMTCAVCE